MKNIYILALIMLFAKELDAQYLLPNPVISFLGEHSREMGYCHRYTFPYDGLGQPFLLETQHALFSRAVALGLSPSGNRPNGFGRVGVPLHTHYNSWASLSGSPRGHMDAAAEVRLNLAPLHNSFFGNYQLMPRQIDRNGDGFRDIPKFERIKLYDQLVFRRGNFRMMAGGGYFRLRSEGGQLDYDRDTDFPDGPLYGIGRNIDHSELFLGSYYNFGPNERHGVSFFASHNHFQEESWFGRREYEASESRLEAALAYRYTGLTDKLVVNLQFRDQRLEEQLEEARLEREPSFTGIAATYRRVISGKFFLKSSLNVDVQPEGRTWVLPMLRLEYHPEEDLQMAIFAGRDYRNAAVIGAYPSLWQSRRGLHLEDTPADDVHYAGLAAEVEDVHLGGMDAELKLAYQYRTYRSKSVIDPWSAAGDSVLVYALDGTADRHQLMANMDVRLHRNWRAKLYYMFVSGRQDTRSGRQPILYGAQHSGLFSLLYHNYRARNRQFSARLDYVVKSPVNLPVEELSAPWIHELHVHADWDLPIWQQKDRTLGVFAGATNLLDQRQTDPYRYAEAPFSQEFDGAGQWGSIVGIQPYLGAKLTW